MRQMKLQSLLVFAFATYLIGDYSQHNVVENFRTTNTIESVPDEHSPLVLISSSLTETVSPEVYGTYTQDIEKLLAVIPVGSEVYLEETNEGGWYLKIEKIFSSNEKVETTKTHEKKEEIDYSVYGEIITI